MLQLRLALARCSQPAAVQLQRIVLDIGEQAKGHLKGGQFVQLKVGESSPGLYAIASPPDANYQGVIELLIKNQGATSELLCSQDAGGSWQMPGCACHFETAAECKCSLVLSWCLKF